MAAESSSFRYEFFESTVNRIEIILLNGDITVTSLDFDCARVVPPGQIVALGLLFLREQLRPFDTHLALFQCIATPSTEGISLNNCAKDARARPSLSDNITRFILREPTKDSLLPWQLENEVAWLTYIAQHHPIPVPKVYAHQSTDPPYIAMEYIPGQPLNEVWSTFTETQKTSAAKEIADVVVKLGEIRFDAIGGLSLQHKPAPTVEGPKLFKGRDKFHSPDCYDIGPYSTTRDYILACYAKEIYYYNHASPNDIDWGLFKADNNGVEEGADVASAMLKKTAFVKGIEQEYHKLLNNPLLSLPEQPFVLCHGDFQGRNIMMQECHIKAILDWEFAGTYSLSELWDRMFDVLEAEDDAGEDENTLWYKRIEGFIADAARAKGWTEMEIEKLIGPSDAILQSARVEMVPWIPPEDDVE
ncbi:MAG: hypothetical protein Q9217_005852 [Psora testacea]